MWQVASSSQIQCFPYHRGTIISREIKHQGGVIVMTVSSCESKGKALELRVLAPLFVFILILLLFTTNAHLKMCKDSLGSILSSSFWTTITTIRVTEVKQPGAS